jgi:2-polyprenyl-6-methoxyphenol hydroxylase-like FAD-dependent oxidoreductase
MAGELKRHGVNVRIVEKKSAPIQHPNAAIVHVRTLEILSAMGAVDGFLKEGYAFPGIHVHAFGKRIGFIDIGRVDSPFPLPRTISQQITERLLNEHLVGLGVLIERQVEAIALEQDANEVRVRVRHLAEDNREETITAKWAVGCEGSDSLTRQALGIEFEGERYQGKEFLQADTFVRWTYPHGYGYQFLTDEYVVMFFAYDQKGHYRIICGRNDLDTENKEPPTLEEIQEIVRSIADPSAELYNPTWFNRFRTGHRFAATFRNGRAFLAGDSGHVHIPIGGQGMNYGIHDAFNLGWKLAAVIKGESSVNLLGTYMTERHSADETLIRGTDRGFHVLVNPHPTLKKALKLFGATLLGVQAVQKRISQTLAEVNVSYPESVLSQDYVGERGPAAGDRAPDAILVKMPDRQTTHLYDILRGTRWTFLLFSGTEPRNTEELKELGDLLTERYRKRMSINYILSGEPPFPAVEDLGFRLLMDREHLVHAKYFVASAPRIFLIRPDWYIGFRGGLGHEDKLSSYLEQVFL